jgi:hypothetical protein
MSEKNPYEIRMDLLKMSTEYLMDMYNTQRHLAERQLTFTEDIMRSISKEAIDELSEAQINFKHSLEKMGEVSKMFPSQELILETAKKFQEFVNSKK